MTTDVKPTALYQRVLESLATGQAGLWIRSHELQEVMLVLHQLETDYEQAEDPAQVLRFVFWDAHAGPHERGKPEPIPGINGPDPAIISVDQLLRVCYNRDKAITNAEAAQHPIDEADLYHNVLVLIDGHRQLVTSEIIAATAKLLHAGKRRSCSIIILSPPGCTPPIELQESFWVIDHELPSPEERYDIIDQVSHNAGEEYENEKLTKLSQITGGLTRLQLEDTCAMSLFRHGDVRERLIWENKAELLNKRGLLRLERSEGKFDSFTNKKGIHVPGLGGLDALKKFSLRALRPGKPEHVRARAFMMLGIPGTGKSAFAKALGNETGRPTLFMDIGALMGSLVGQTESNVREALSIVDNMAPAILFVDEAEKALAGRSGNDSGVSARMFGSLLTWLNDHTSDVLFIATANDIRALPPEFTRAERFDGIFFLDLPGREQKDAIWKIYLQYYALGEEIPSLDDSTWTGAEIKACCRLSALLDVPLVEAAQHVVPVVRTAAEQVRALRNWAKDRCLDAEAGGVYVHRTASKEHKESTVEAPVEPGRRPRRQIVKRAPEPE